MQDYASEETSRQNAIYQYTQNIDLLEKQMLELEKASFYWRDDKQCIIKLMQETVNDMKRRRRLRQDCY